MPLWAYCQTKPPPGTLVNLSNQLAQNIVLALPFNEQSGSNVYDASQQCPSGSFEANAPTWTSGKWGTALNFISSSSQELSLPNCNAMAFGTNPFTLATWIYVADLVSAWVAIITKGRDITSNYFGLWLNTSNEFNAGSSTGDVQSSTTTVGWHQVVCTFNPQVLYVDGVLAASSALNNSATNTGLLRVGGDAGSDAYFQGIVDHVILSARAWTLADVQSHYANPWQIFNSPNSSFLMNSAPLSTSPPPSPYLVFPSMYFPSMIEE